MYLISKKTLDNLIQLMAIADYRLFRSYIDALLVMSILIIIMQALIIALGMLKNIFGLWVALIICTTLVSAWIFFHNHNTYKKILERKQKQVYDGIFKDTVKQEINQLTGENDEH